jgi:lipopolysaccharide export system permease protein
MPSFRHFEFLARLKTLHNYITRQILVTLFMTVGVFTFVVLLFNVLKEILPILINGGGHLLLIAKAVGLLTPFAAVYALPMGFITAALLVFGRLSADQELTAARASGISLFSMILPVLLLSLLFCGFSAWFNMELGPRSRVAYIALKGDLAAALIDNFYLPSDTTIRDFPGYTFYTEKNDNGNLQTVLICHLLNETNVDYIIKAPGGMVIKRLEKKQWFLNLTNAQMLRLVPSGATNGDQSSFFTSWNSPNFYPTNDSGGIHRGPKVSDMTFSQLSEELKRLQSLTFPITSTNQTELRAKIADMRKQIRDDPAEVVRFEMNRQVAFSFACFGFTLIGIPLGIRMQRRETNIGISIALALVLVYFSFVMVAQSLAARPDFAPHLIVWLPNFLFQAVGAVLLWRANRGAV